MVLVPAVLMVSTIRFRSFKTIDLQIRRPYSVLLLFAAGIMLVVTHVQIALVVMAYTYLVSAFVGMAISRVKRRGDRDTSGQDGRSGSPPVPLRDSAAR
jgi:CDP-diacylglycerol--serine O-phosphatidyltransferase